MDNKNFNYSSVRFETTKTTDQTVKEVEVNNKKIIPILFIPNMMGSYFGEGITNIAADDNVTVHSSYDEKDEKNKKAENEKTWGTVTKFYREFIDILNKKLNSKQVESIQEIDGLVERIKINYPNKQYEIWAQGFNWRKNKKDLKTEILTAIDDIQNSHIKRYKEKTQVLLISYGMSNIIADQFKKDYDDESNNNAKEDEFIAESNNDKILKIIYVNQEKWYWRNFAPTEGSGSIVCKGSKCQCMNELWQNGYDFSDFSLEQQECKIKKVKTIFDGKEWEEDFKHSIENMENYLNNNKEKYRVFKISMDKLQNVRDEVKHAISLSSGYRCRVHNSSEGGSKKSAHCFIAFDCRIQSTNANYLPLAKKALDVGFKGFGFATSFLHIDMRDNTGADFTTWFYTTTESTTTAKAEVEKYNHEKNKI